MSEEELAAEIEKQRTLNAARGVGSRSSVYLHYLPNVGEGDSYEGRLQDRA
jgi:hypothetical protein